MSPLTRCSVRRPRTALPAWAALAITLAVAVALDALIVRPVLLPAATALLGRRSWWPTHVGAPAARGTTLEPTAGGAA